jgi:purine-binding chemotaxis protein CheW
MKKSTEFITFYLDKFFFGILATEVMELKRGLKITPVPKSPTILRGIVNLRGEIVPAINMHKHFNLKSPCKGDESISIILKPDGMVIALLVDEVGEFLQLHVDTFEPPPKNFPQETLDLILGVHKLSDNLLIIVDATKIAPQLMQQRSFKQITRQPHSCIG